MEEIVKHINDTNASYRNINAGDAKNTDLFLDNEQYELFKDSGEQITVRFNKENLTKAILFIASILPRKYDNSATHKQIPFSEAFVYDQLAFLDGFFTVDGVKVESRTQIWTARKDVLKKNGEVDNRFYFNGLLEDVSYTSLSGIVKNAKFTIRNYLAGGYSDLHIKKSEKGVFDVWITNALEPYDNGKEKGLEIIDTEKTPSLQQIFYGAPGTGKSHEIKEKTKGESVIRTTFHPDSDYSTFVGAYKPTMDDVDAKVVPVVLGESGTVFNKNEGTYKEKRIVYQFVMQAFLKAYLGAWKKYAEADGNEVDPQFLIIEEINRGNCAQIFGDLFQLLDRGDNGFSEYPIEADNDLQREIERAFIEHKDYKLKEGIKIKAEGAVKDYTSNYGATLSEDIQSGRVLLLPSNLYIWATMNTSDQSLFPIDSAFKRRWDWKYLPIENAEKGWKIKVNGNEYDWYKFLEAINKEVLGLTHSEDKQLGYFFAKAKDSIIDAETLVNKVYFYLWTDVFKDYDYESQKAFRKPNSNEPIAFRDFFKKGQELDETMAEQVLINLELEKLNKPQDLFE